MVGVRRAEEIFPPQIEGEQVKLTIRPALPHRTRKKSPAREETTPGSRAIPRSPATLVSLVSLQTFRTTCIPLAFQ